MPLHAVALYRLTILFLFTSTEMHLHSVSTGDIPPVKHTKKDILLDVLGMTNQTYPTLALSKSGYGSKLTFTLSHRAPQSSLSVYADTTYFASMCINLSTY